MATFVSDTFTDTDTTLLGSHTGETGATWTRFIGVGTARITSNHCYVETTSGWAASGVPAGADYYVEAVLRTGTLTGTPASRSQAIVLREVGQNYYSLQVNEHADTISLRKLVGGVSTFLDGDPLVLSASTDYTLKLEAQGSTLTGYVDGVQLVQATDTALTAAGKAGLYSPDNNSPTTDLLLASLTAVDSAAPVSPPVVTSITPENGTSEGGTEVVIAGTDLSSVNQVSFGSAPAASFVLDSAIQITAVSPEGIPGSTVDVIVSTASASSANTAADDYTYDAVTTDWTPASVRIKT